MVSPNTVAELIVVEAFGGFSVGQQCPPLVHRHICFRTAGITVTRMIKKLIQ